MQERMTNFEKMLCMENGNKSFSQIRDALTGIKNRISESNFRDLKTLLIDQQRELKLIDLERDQRNELRQLIDECFEKISFIREQEQRAFEYSSEKTRERLSPLVEKALFESRYNDDTREAWDFCISVQNEFRGIRLQKEIREMLYQQLQEAFDMLKERRSQEQGILEKKSVSAQRELMPEVEQLVAEAAATDDLDAHWTKLIALQQEIRDQALTHESRRLLLDKLQQAFDALKSRKEKRQIRLEEESLANALGLEEMIAEGEVAAAEAEDFRMAFDRLKQIQQAFRELSLPREEREILYQRLQQAFDTLKGRQEAWFNERDRETTENYNRLKPLVINAMDRARTSSEFKKTREMLKHVQAQFKGLRMKAERREELYSQLQKAFDILNRRHDEYLATKKDKMELRVDYQLSDIELRLEDLEKEIEKDLEQIEALSETGDNPLFKGGEADPSGDIHNQAEVLKAALARKQGLLEELLQEKETLLQKKDKWAGLGQEGEEA